MLVWHDVDGWFNVALHDAFRRTGRGPRRRAADTIGNACRAHLDLAQAVERGVQAGRLDLMTRYGWRASRRLSSSVSRASVDGSRLAHADIILLDHDLQVRKVWVGGDTIR